MMAWMLIKLVLEGVAIFLIATFLFDICHYLLHVALRSKNKFWKKVGLLHSYHHRFYARNLQYYSKWQNKNLYISITLEYGAECFLILCGFFFFNPYAVCIALLILCSLFIFILAVQGKDPHHRAYDRLPAYPSGLFVTGAYHALHHIYPNHFFGSYMKLFDFIFGTANPLQGKLIALSGASGALGSNMKRLLEKEGATVIPLKYGVDYTYENYDNLKTHLARADILCLCHGSKYDNTQAANCDSFIAIIELFRSVRERKLLPLEVWGVGSEIECHPYFGIKKLKGYATSKRNFARKARLYFRDRDFIYRHIVHSAFTSKMGPGLMSANFAAKATIFWLKRGLKYIPVTYTGFALLNYLYF